MRLGDEDIKIAVPRLLLSLGAALVAPIVLPLLASITRPLAKEAIRLYFDLAEDIHEVVAHHQVRRRKPIGLLRQVLSAGSEELVTEGLEAVAEETLTETAVEGIVEIL
jgi:hypothetical protein